MATPELPPGITIVSAKVSGVGAARQERAGKETSIKAVLLGDYGVGKTTLFKRIQEKELFNNSTSSSWNSQSMDLYNLSIRTGDKKVQLHLWDTAGAERYRTLTLDFFRKALIIFLIYRTDRLISLTNLQYWKSESETYAPAKATYILVGNVFTDGNMEVPTETADEFANRHDISTHIRLSATTAAEANVMGMLTSVVDKVINSTDTTMPDMGTVDLNRQTTPPAALTSDMTEENSKKSKWCWCT